MKSILKGICIGILIYLLFYMLFLNGDKTLFDIWILALFAIGGGVYTYITKNYSFNTKNQDPVYSLVNEKEKRAYQIYFNKALKIIDLYNETDRALGKSYNKQQATKDDKKLEKLFLEAHEMENLSIPILQVLLQQYLLADVWLRERHSTSWIDKAMSREKTDFFPDSSYVYHEVFNEFK